MKFLQLKFDLWNIIFPFLKQQIGNVDENLRQNNANVKT